MGRFEGGSNKKPAWREMRRSDAYIGVVRI
jgi:hypothetical protein